MASLTALDSSNNFDPANLDLDTSGYVAMVPAYQKVYFADGRPFSENDPHLTGYHKLDFINTRLVATLTPVQKDTFTTTTTSYSTASPTTWQFQTFTAGSDYSLSQLILLLYRSGSPGSVTVGIYNVEGGIPVGDVIATGTLNGNTLATGSPYTLQTIKLNAPVILTSGTQYAIVVHSQHNGLRWRKVTAGGYAGGTNGHSSNSGLSWTTETADFYFDLYAVPTLVRGEIVTQNTSEVQTLVPDHKATAGSFTITFGVDTTISLNWDSSLLDIQSALDVLPSLIAAGGVIVTGYTFNDAINWAIGITLTFNPSAGDVAAVSVDTSGLTPTITVTVTETVTGNDTWLRAYMTRRLQ
jgi:hypothetical protein